MYQGINLWRPMEIYVLVLFTCLPCLQTLACVYLHINFSWCGAHLQMSAHPNSNQPAPSMAPDMTLPMLPADKSPDIGMAWVRALVLWNSHSNPFSTLSFLFSIISSYQDYLIWRPTFHFICFILSEHPFFHLIFYLVLWTFVKCRTSARFSRYQKCGGTENIGYSEVEGTSASTYVLHPILNPWVFQISEGQRWRRFWRCGGRNGYLQAELNRRGWSWLGWILVDLQTETT